MRRMGLDPNGRSRRTCDGRDLIQMEGLVDPATDGDLIQMEGLLDLASRGDLIQVEDLVDLATDGAIVGVGFHNISHKVPPFLRDLVTSAL